VGMRIVDAPGIWDLILSSPTRRAYYIKINIVNITMHCTSRTRPPINSGDEISTSQGQTQAAQVR